MHNHFQQGNGRNAYILEIVGVPLPRLVVADMFLLVIFVRIEGITVGIDKPDRILKLCYR